MVLKVVECLDNKHIKEFINNHSDKRIIYYGSSHSLHKGIEYTSTKHLRNRKSYTKAILVLDGCFDVLSVYNGISKHCMLGLIEAGYFVVEDNKVTYNHEQYPITSKWEFSELVEYCDEGLVTHAGGGLLVVEQNKNIFNMFDEVWLFTCMFHGSVMSSWCKINNINFNIVKDVVLEDKKDINIKLINTRSMTKIENLQYSQAWYDKQNEIGESSYEGIRKCLTSICSNHSISVSDILITCPEDSWDNLKGKGYSRAQWTPSSMKSNMYEDKGTLIYALDKHPNPVIYNMCVQNGYKIDKDLYALGYMIQWVWNGNVNNMNLVVLSKRMRDLFKEWLEEDSFCLF